VIYSAFLFANLITVLPCDVMGLQVRRSSFNYICNAIWGEGVLKIRRDMNAFIQGLFVCVCVRAGMKVGH